MAEDWEGWGGRAPVPHGGVEGKTSPRTAGVGESIAPWDYSNPVSFSFSLFRAVEGMVS